MPFKFCMLIQYLALLGTQNLTLFQVFFTHNSLFHYYVPMNFKFVYNLFSYTIKVTESRYCITAFRYDLFSGMV